MQGGAGECKGCRGGARDARGCRGIQGDARGCKGMEGMQGDAMGMLGDAGRCRVCRRMQGGAGGCRTCTPLHPPCIPCILRPASCIAGGASQQPSQQQPKHQHQCRLYQTKADHGRPKHSDTRGATSNSHAFTSFPISAFSGWELQWAI